MTTNLTLRVDSDLRREAESLFSELGMSVSTALTIFLRQAVRVQGIPFAIGKNTVNRATLAAMREAERIADDPSVPAFSTIEDLRRSLES